MNPDLSVVVPSLGGARKLPALLDALAGQSVALGIQWEVIVVVDGVVDDTIEVLRRYRDRIPVEALTFPHNRGRSAALNAGFEAAKGRVLVRCDDDLTPREDFVARHLSHHDHLGPIVGAVGLCPNVASFTRYDRVYGRAAARRSIDGGYSLDPFLRWHLWAANCSVTRQTYELVGPYDEGFREYGWEDIDWGYRLHQAGVPIEVDRDLEAAHRGVPPTAQSRIDRAFASGRARAAFEAKHESAWSDGVTVAERLPAAVRAWNAAVHSVANMGGRAGWHRGGAVVDALLPVLPDRVASKLVAFGVEGAGVAGARDGQRRPT